VRRHQNRNRHTVGVTDCSVGLHWAAGDSLSPGAVVTIMLQVDEPPRGFSAEGRSIAAPRPQVDEGGEVCWCLIEANGQAASKTPDYGL